MGKMSLWQIDQYRAGWQQLNNPAKQPEDKARAEFDNMTDDDFFAGLGVKPGGEEIDPEDFFK